LNLYTNSLHKAIKASLDSGGADVALINAQTLGGELLFAMYHDIPLDVLKYNPITLNAALEDVFEGFTANAVIAVSYMAQVKDAAPHQPEETENVIDEESGDIIDVVVIVPEKPREPKTADIQATAEITVTITHTHSGKAQIMAVKYDFTGGVLDDRNLSSIIEPGAMAIRNPGTWRVVYG
jgi:hypothetical protein